MARRTARRRRAGPGDWRRPVRCSPRARRAASATAGRAGSGRSARPAPRSACAARCPTAATSCRAARRPSARTARRGHPASPGAARTPSAGRTCRPSGSVEYWSERTMFAPASYRNRDTLATMPGRSGQEISRRSRDSATAHDVSRGAGECSNCVIGPELSDARVDLAGGQPLDALGAELLDVVRGERRPVRHRLAHDRLGEAACRGGGRDSRRIRRRTCRRRPSGRRPSRGGTRGARRTGAR